MYNNHSYNTGWSTSMSRFGQGINGLTFIPLYRRNITEGPKKWRLYGTNDKVSYTLLSDYTNGTGNGINVIKTNEW